MKTGIKKPENIRVGGNYRLLEMLLAGHVVQCGQWWWEEAQINAPEAEQMERRTFSLLLSRVPEVQRAPKDPPSRSEWGHEAAECAETRCKWQRPPLHHQGPTQSPGSQPNQPSGPSPASPKGGSARVGPSITTMHAVFLVPSFRRQWMRQISGGLTIFPKRLSTGTI